ncbi:hypothetical protein [Vagococcus bubulae]|uniref:Uncharacterized protein n=1 Tax=Vagococcus bubulae TaxID=1977868 RepID=A0A429ZDZ0_9ENTE|nr:hypothetical protein [Vagococcus bubulae]RST91912.1 hypothetical protein CBF36_09310 [Vagococcus bubulae]
MGIYKQEIDKLKQVKQLRAKEQAEIEEYEAFKQMSFSESENLRKTNFNKWFKFSTREQTDLD